MIIDDRLEFLDAESCIMVAGNNILGDVVDTASAPTLKNLGVTPVYFVVTVDTAFTGAGSTFQVQFCSDSTADLATSKTIHCDTGAVAVATLKAGYTMCIPLPSNGTYERYVGCWVTAVGAAGITAGKMNAFLTIDPAPYQTALPDAI